MGGSKRTVLFLFKSSTYATIPPSYLKSWLLSERSSRITTRSPGLRNASSRIRLESTSKLNAAAIVLHRHGSVGVDGQLDGLRVAGERLVDGVVHDLVHEVVQALGADPADVHVRALADSLQPFQDLDAVSRVLTRRGHRRRCPLLVRCLQNLTSGKYPELSPGRPRKQGEKASPSL